MSDPTLLEQIEVLHQRQPADSPFNREGRDVCGTCMDGYSPADWPCPTISAARALPDRDALVRYVKEGDK